MMSPKLPSVLQQPNGNSISIERALKQALDLLDFLPINTPQLEDAVNATQDDLYTMLRAIDRE